MTGRVERQTRAAQRLRAAHHIIDELELFDRWAPYGEPVLVGSVALGLVVRPDIDLEIYADTPSIRHGFAVASAMAELLKVRRAVFLDERDRGAHGLYWKVEYELTPEQTWTVDMWLFARDGQGSFAASLTNAVAAALTDELRDTILAIKEEASARAERAHGPWLYRAVLDAGVRTYAEYLAWLGDQNVYERTTWHPSPR